LARPSKLHPGSTHLQLVNYTIKLSHRILLCHPVPHISLPKLFALHRKITQCG